MDIHILKSAGFRIRVEPELRDLFVSACKEEDLSAAQVLRSFMKDYIKNYELAKQKDLFIDSNPSRES